MEKKQIRSIVLLGFAVLLFITGCGSSSDDGMTATDYESGLRSDCRLESLEFSTPVALIPTFDPETLFYEISVYKDTESLSITPRLYDRFSKMTVNGTALENGGQSPPVALSLGSTTPLAIIVTAENGDTREYTITIYRSDKSTITSLASVRVPGLDLIPAFKNNPKGPWEVVVPAEQAAITVSVTATDALCRQVMINGVAFEGPRGMIEDIALEPGITRAIVITVNAQEEGVSDSYVIKATRAGDTTGPDEEDPDDDDTGGGDSGGTLSGNVELSGMTLRYGSTMRQITPVAGQATPVSVPWDCSKVTISAHAAEAPAVTINGGKSPATLDILRHQSNQVTLHVVAENGSYADYVLNIKREVSGETALANFDVNSERNTTVSWFSVDKDGPWYCLLRHNVAAYSFSAETLDSWAQITSAALNGEEIPITYGGSETLNIEKGDIHNISFTVTAEDPTVTRSYEVRVYRHRSALAMNGNIRDLEVYYMDDEGDRVNLLSGFSSNTFTYTLEEELPNTVSALSVLPYENNPAQLISVDGYATAGSNWPDDAEGQLPVNIPVPPGTHTITVYSQSPNGADSMDINTREYNVIVTRGYSGNTALTHLSIQGLTEVLDLDNPSGQLGGFTPETGLSSLVLTATAQDPHITGIDLRITRDTGESSTLPLSNGWPVDIAVESGVTTLEISVTADNSVSVTTCSLKVNTPLSSDTGIIGIQTADGTVSGGSDDWHLRMAQAAQEVALTVIPSDPAARLILADWAGNPIAPQSEGTMDYTVPVSGTTESQFDLTVTAENGEVQVHTLTIEPPLSEDDQGMGRLSNISVTMGDKFESPRPLNLDFTEPVLDSDPSVFSPSIFSYDVLVYGFDTVKIRVTAQEGTGVEAVTINNIKAEDITGTSPTQAFLYNGNGFVTPVNIVVTDKNAQTVTYTLHVKLLNIHEFFRGVYGGLMNEVYDSKWEPMKPSGLGDDITVNGDVSGKLHWYTKASTNGCIADSIMNLTNYNDGQFGVNHVNGGIVVVGETLGCFDAQKTGYVTGGYRIYTPEGDLIAYLDYHLYSYQADKVERDDAYTDCKYMSNTPVRMKYYHSSNPKSESPFNPEYYPDYDYYSNWVLE